MRLGLYYIDFTKSIGEDFSEYEFDEQGIPLVNFLRSPEWQHNPVTVCQYALAQFNLFYRTGDIKSKDKFLTQVNWLVENQQTAPNNSAVWYYRMNAPFYKLKSPWISGMAQGQALSVLLRAFQLSNDNKYYSLAERVWNIFSVLVEDGGVIAKFPDGLPVIEEYPSRTCSCVLNGFILALFGIYDYWLVTKDTKYLHFFECYIESLKKNLNRYDTTYWSLYDLWQPYRLTSKVYHRLHIILLKKLFEITNEKLFLEISESWQQNLTSPLCNFKWGINKIKQRIILIL